MQLIPFATSILLGLAALGQTVAVDSRDDSSGLIPADTYKRDIAPEVLKRITDFRTDRDTLIQPQNAYLDKVTEKVKRADSSDLSGLKTEGDSLFGRDALDTMFYGELPRGLEARESQEQDLTNAPLADCQCTDNHSFCKDGLRCQYKAQNCSFKKGCGPLWAYVCNGLCVR